MHVSNQNAMSKSWISMGSFELFRIIQAVWALILAVWVILYAFSDAGLMSRIWFYVAVAYIYLFASWGVFLNYRWAWVVSIIFLLGYLFLGAIGGYPLVHTFRALFAVRELFHINPLSVILIFLHAPFFVFLPTCLLILAAISTKGIIKVLRGQPMPTSDP
jgi:hypothetical protein